MRDALGLEKWKQKPVKKLFKKLSRQFKIEERIGRRDLHRGKKELIPTGSTPQRDLRRN